MARRKPIGWEIPQNFKFDLVTLMGKLETDFNPNTPKGHVDLLMHQALKSISNRENQLDTSSEKFHQLVHDEFQSLLETNSFTFTQSTKKKMEVLGAELWKELKEKRSREGMEHHLREYEAGNCAGLGILGPTIIPGGGPPIPLREVTLSLDQNLLYRQRMLSLAQDILTEDFLINEQPNPILTQVLSDIVAGESLYDSSIGELFELYGELVNHLPEDDKKKKLNKWINSKGFKEKYSDSLLGEDKSFTAPYYSYSKNGYSAQPKSVPLPFAIRNALAHQEARNPNVALLERLPHGVHDSVVILRAIKSEYFGRD